MDSDIASCDSVLNPIGANIGVLKLLRRQRAAKTWQIAPLPALSYFSPADAAWLMMRDSALLPLVPKTLAENYWKLEATSQWLTGVVEDTGRSRVHRNAMISLHDDADPFALTEIETLLIALSDYAEALRHLRAGLSSYNAQIHRVLENRSLDFRQVAEDERKQSP